MAIDLERDRALRQRVRLERYATILGHVLFFGAERTREVAAHFGLDVDTWLAVDAAWGRELAECARRQQNQQATRFTAVLFRTRAELSARPVSLEPGAAAPRGGVPAGVDRPATPRPLAAASFQLAAAKGTEPAPAAPLPAVDAKPPAPAPAPVAAGAPPAPKVHLPGAPEPVFATKTAELRESRVQAARERGAHPFEGAEALPISLETYARVTAGLAQRSDRAEVLAEAQLDEERWQSVARRWSDRLRSDQGLMRKYIELVAKMKKAEG